MRANDYVGRCWIATQTLWISTSPRYDLQTRRLMSSRNKPHLLTKRRFAKLSAAISLCLLNVACLANFKEVHYFQQVRSGATASNYLRLTVSGHAWLSSSRYLAGFYDERAVDLFFNEIKQVAPACSGTECAVTAVSAIRPICVSESDQIGGCNKLGAKPPSDNGAFLMLFSTNASAVSDAIGQFAENQSVADALTGVFNRDAIKSARSLKASSQTAANQRQAVADDLDANVAAIPPESAGAIALRAGVLRVLNASARGLGNSVPFRTIDEARAWFRGAAP